MRQDRSVGHRNIGIQWMRAIAALLVVVDHCFYTLVDKASGDAAALPLAAFLGGSGVQIFFLVSGFVMVMSATQRFGVAASIEFIRRRLIRVVPLYWIVTLIYAAKLHWAGDLPVPADVIRSLLFIPHSNAHGEVVPVYGLGWTLDYEMLFYAIFAIGLLGSLRTTVVFATAAIVALAAYGLSCSGPGDTRLSTMVFFWTRPILLFFLMGMALPWLARRWQERRAAPIMRIDHAALATSAMVLIALVAGYRFGLPMPAQLVALALPVLFAASTMTVGLNDSSGHPLVRVATLLGDASYSIYLTHSFMIGPMARGYAMSGIQAPIAFIGISLVVCSAVGMLCFRYVETPLLRRLSARRREVVAIGATT